jgi:hypothetical protein
MLRVDVDVCQDFILTVPALSSRDARVKAIHERGNLPLYIANAALAEFSHQELLQNWQSTMALPQAKLEQLTQNAGDRLGAILAEECSSDSISEMVTDAAVLFLLAMRRHGINQSERITPCRVKWHGQSHQETVTLLA